MAAIVELPTQDSRDLPEPLGEQAGDFVVNCERAARHPDVRAFVALCDAARGGDVLDFDMLQERPFMPYWRALTIQRWDAARSDFVHVFFGTGLVSTYGCDFTGKTLAESHGANAEIARQASLHVLKERRPLYYSGAMAWQNKSFLKFVGVVVPLKRHGVVNEIAAWGCRV